MQHYMKDNTTVYVYALPVLDSRMYIIPNTTNPSDALIIDPIISSDALDVLAHIDTATVLLTHSHYDHIHGVNWIKKQVNATVFCSQTCAKNIASPSKNLSAFSPALQMNRTEEEQQIVSEMIDLKYCCEADKTFETETTFDFGDYHVELIHTPGHSPCSQCIRLTTKAKNLTPEIVFTGDSLVNGHPVITRLPGGNKNDYQTITKPFLDNLSEETIIMPGHGDWATKKEIESDS